MEKIISVVELDNAIAELNQRKAVTRYQIEGELKELGESLSASNILKNTVENFGGSEAIKTKAASSAIGIGSGWVIQKLFSGNSKSVFKNIAGKVLQFAITGLVAKNSGGFVKKAIDLLEKRTK